jgi:hypothetical protein
MTVEELIARLEDIRDELGGDTEVRLMTQQNWPFENTIEGLCSSREIAEAYDDDEEDEDYGDEPVVLFIVEGKHLGYGTKKAWEVCS